VEGLKFTGKRCPRGLREKSVDCGKKMSKSRCSGKRDREKGNVARREGGGIPQAGEHEIKGEMTTVRGE